MTRGRIAIIDKNFKGEVKVYSSIEFNGDMYMPTKKWAGKGRIVTNLLKKVNDMASYRYAVAKFNNEHHHYNDRDYLIFVNGGEEVLDFTNHYFDNWFSDYIYIKNIMQENVIITIKDKNDNTKNVLLGSGEIARICFGTLQRITK